jgi:hypothetical protein
MAQIKSRVFKVEARHRVQLGVKIAAPEIVFVGLSCADPDFARFRVREPDCISERSDFRAEIVTKVNFSLRRCAALQPFTGGDGDTWRRVRFAETACFGATVVVIHVQQTGR